MVSENLNLWSGFLLVHTIVCVQKAVYITSVSVLNTFFKKKQYVKRVNENFHMMRASYTWLFALTDEMSFLLF